MVDTSNYLSCGYLSPEGIMYTCTSFGHLSLAKRICESRGYIDDMLKIKPAMNALDCEDYLFALGYVCVRDRCVRHCCLDRWQDVGSKRFYARPLTDTQVRFLQSKLDKCCNVEQYDDLKLILDQNDIRNLDNDWVNKEGE